MWDSWGDAAAGPGEGQTLSTGPPGRRRHKRGGSGSRRRCGELLTSPPLQVTGSPQLHADTSPENTLTASGAAPSRWAREGNHRSGWERGRHNLSVHCTAGVVTHHQEGTQNLERPPAEWRVHAPQRQEGVSTAATPEAPGLLPGRGTLDLCSHRTGHISLPGNPLGHPPPHQAHYGGGQTLTLPQGDRHNCPQGGQLTACRSPRPVSQAWERPPGHLLSRWTQHGGPELAKCSEPHLSLSGCHSCRRADGPKATLAYLISLAFSLVQSANAIHEKDKYDATHSANCSWFSHCSCV